MRCSVGMCEFNQEHPMSDNGKLAHSSRPLLLKFARPQGSGGPGYHYDPAQSLNISIEDGAPIVASAHGRSRLKTLAEARGED
jgi:hypothetical protein